MSRKRDRIYWVVQERTKLFAWKAHSLYKTKREAEEVKLLLESESKFGVLGYKVDRVELVG